MIDMCLCSHCARIFPRAELREYSMPMLQYKVSTLPSGQTFVDMVADESKDILTVKKRLCPQCREELAELVWRWSTFGEKDSNDIL